MFACPTKTFKQVVKKKSTENYKGLPYITTLLSTSLWTFYGLLKPGALLVVTVNGAGVAMHVVYVTLFLIYAPKNIKIRSLKLVAAVNVAFLGAVVVVTLAALKGGVRITLVGVLCAGLTFAMYAAPLSAMRTVIRTKSVKYMPFLLSFFQFFNGGVWSAYALLVKDYYIGVPNGIGFLLGSAQLLLYAIYNNNHSGEGSGSRHLEMQDLDENDEEMGSMKNRGLNKNNSLPKPPIIRQYSLNVRKSLSLTPHEFEKLTDKGFSD